MENYSSDSSGPILYSHIEQAFYSKKSGTSLITKEFLPTEDYQTNWSGTPNE